MTEPTAFAPADVTGILVVPSMMDFAVTVQRM